MTSITVTTKIENNKDTNGRLNQRFIKKFPIQNLPFKVDSSIEGDYYLNKNLVVLPSWANFSDEDYLYTVKINDEHVSIKAATPGLVDLASLEVFKNYMEDDVYLTKKNLGEIFTFKKRKNIDNTEIESIPINIFAEEDY